jgi:hypothetical protein
MDKVAHFGVGGLITAIFTLVFVIQDMGSLIFHPWKMMLYPVIGTVVTTLVSIMKEKLLDAKPDWNDVYAALIGSALIFIANFFGILFFIGTMKLQ